MERSMPVFPRIQGELCTQRLAMLRELSGGKKHRRSIGKRAGGPRPTRFLRWWQRKGIMRAMTGYDLIKAIEKTHGKARLTGWQFAADGRWDTAEIVLLNDVSAATPGQL